MPEPIEAQIVKTAAEQKNTQQIGSICKVSKSIVKRYLERLKAAGLSWTLPSDLDDVAL